MKTTDKPLLQSYHLEGVKHILPEDAFEAYKNNMATLVDVREDYETETERIEDVLFHPMQRIAQWLPGLERNRHLIIFCHKGMRSTHVTHFLIKEGYPHVVNLDGGIEAWIERGLPFKQLS